MANTTLPLLTISPASMLGLRTYLQSALMDRCTVYEPITTGFDVYMQPILTWQAVGRYNCKVKFTSDTEGQASTQLAAVELITEPQVIIPPSYRVKLTKLYDTDVNLDFEVTGGGKRDYASNTYQLNRLTDGTQLA